MSVELQLPSAIQELILSYIFLPRPFQVEYENKTRFLGKEIVDARIYHYSKEQNIAHDRKRNVWFLDDPIARQCRGTKNAEDFVVQDKYNL